jgi:phenylalanyl-tRNA synthetase, beta subunit, non-spirochete bacterial
MIAPYKWLCDYVDMDALPDELAKKLIMTGSAVDGYKELGAEIRHVVAGKILSISKHPDADKLSVCMVDAGGEPLQIVCGAHNIFAGATVPVALVGACLPGGMKINKGKLRGVYSNGMLCSGAELGIAEETYPGAGVDGIMILRENVPAGTPLRELLGLSDVIFEIEVGANRPDCLSMIGVARECAASLEKGLRLPETGYTPGSGNIADYVSVKVEDTKLCERYIARAVKNVSIGPSPDWMRDRLLSAGIRAINNIVDITNFVMLEMGQPMHAFDHNDIRGRQIVVRRANKGETITTLDEKERALTEEMLLICDAQGPIGIAGVMGGENSGIRDNTTTVVFESAKFSLSNVRRTSRALGLQTESAMRFSKGIDAVGCKTAMDRALHLIQQLGAGEIVPGEIDLCAADLSPRGVSVSADKINAILGTDIPAEDMAALLRRAFIPATLRDGLLSCEIPSFRGDIRIGEDIAEEVARMYGYDRIPLVPMTGFVQRGTLPADERCIDKARARLTALGCYECVTYSFCSAAEPGRLGLSEGDPRRSVVKIINPLGDDQGYMRTSPVPDMLRVVAANINRKVEDIRLFESGRVYLNVNPGDLPDERKYICIGLCGDEDFFTLKGTVENLLEAYGIRGARFMPDASDYYHPGRKAGVYVKNDRLGEMGEVHPDIADKYGIGRRVYVAELSVAALCAHTDEALRYRPLPKFPAVERDLALTVGGEVSAGSLLECIKKNGGAYLESAALFDVYTDEKLGAGKKSLAFKIVLRAKDRTLTDGEANAARDAIVAAAAKATGAALRE